MLDWLENDLLLTISGCEPASSDASFRRYFRVQTADDCTDAGDTTARTQEVEQCREQLPRAMHGAIADDCMDAGSTTARTQEVEQCREQLPRAMQGAIAEQAFIVMDAPPGKENLEPFIRIAALLARSQVKAPIIYQQNLAEGFLLLEDFGSLCLLDRLNDDSATELYQNACDNLFKLQTLTPVDSSGLPGYDQPLLLRELAIFDEWFLGQLLDIQIPAALWEPVRSLLTSSALEQPSVCVHRDYHSRNLMVLDGNTIGVIDFQDAVIGPITYDLVSLLRDCYIAWPESQVEQWRSGYFERLRQAGLIDCSPDQFKRWFDLMGLQRHLKAIGIFSRLHLRDGKSNYLGDIPRTLNHVATVCAAYPELAEFNTFLHTHVLPVLSKVEV